MIDADPVDSANSVDSVDYLVIGAGAMGMAFTDVLMTESDATVALVDRRPRPGGHWNDAYPHVRLHQPSSFYGVNSRVLGTESIDAYGWNEGLSELASGTEVVAYFDQVLRQQFMPTGRVQFFGMSEYVDGAIRSLVSGDTTTISAAKVVNAGYMNVTVPSVRPPDYDVADGVVCIPPNDLGKPGVLPGDGAVIVGAGKTAMDAALFLLESGMAPGAITWIRPRDQWCLDRANIQPGSAFFEHTAGGQAAQYEAVIASDGVEDLFARLEAAGVLLRFDDTVKPTMYRCATVSTKELEAMRTITDVVRMGRVQRIGTDEIELDEGTIATTPTTVHIDCTADGLERRPALPVFDANTITLQTVRTCQQVFSAALIAHVEVAYSDEATKNELATVVPHPDTDLDWLRNTLANLVNSGRWRQDEALAEWLQSSRLDGFARMRSLSGDDATPERLALLDRIMTAAIPAAMKLAQYVAELD